LSMFVFNDWIKTCSFFLKFSAPGIYADFRPLDVRPEVFAFYLHFGARAWPGCMPVAFASVFIFLYSYKIFASSAFFIWVHIAPHFCQEKFQSPPSPATGLIVVCDFVCMQFFRPGHLQ